MESDQPSDGAPRAFLRLPVRRVEAIAAVAARLRGDVAGPCPGSVIPGGRPGVEGFPWAREDAATSEQPRDSDADADDLNDWQRQWLATDDDDARADAVDAHAAGPPASPGGWWEDIPAVRQVLLDGLDLGAATVFVGENGSGKSTIVEGLAMAYGLAPEGGSGGSRHRSRVTESGLGSQLELVKGVGRKGGYFLRAETMHAFFTYLAENPRLPSQGSDIAFHEMSHGESFVSLVEDRFKPSWPGLYLLDEPESALSFDNQLRLLRHLQTLMATGRHQIVMATHSPILAALPGAALYELDDRGMREVDHDDATLVRTWRHFMNDPSAYLD